jgi:hypothetical protein
MISNRPRRRISPEQVSLLQQLRDGQPHMAADLGGDSYRNSDINRRQRVASVKRALRQLEHWAMVRTFHAPHREADKTWGDYLDETRGRWQRRGMPDRWLTIAAMRQQGRIAPSGNRRQPALWAEITDAGRAVL